MQVGSSCDNFLSKLIEEKGSHHSNHMPVMDFIDITSSDDEVVSWNGDSQRSPTSRILPPWAPTHSTNSRTTGVRLIL